MAARPSEATGSLSRYRVVELAADGTAFAGKLLAELGADVIVVEPPGGSAQRGYGPFADDEPGPENSLHWWHYYASKRSVTLDLDDVTPGGGAEQFRRLCAGADVVLEGERPGAAGRTEARLRRPSPAASRPHPLLHHPVRPFRAPQRGTRHRPHRAGGSRAGMELRVRRS